MFKIFFRHKFPSSFVLLMFLLYNKNRKIKIKRKKPEFRSQKIISDGV